MRKSTLRLIIGGLIVMSMLASSAWADCRQGFDVQPSFSGNCETRPPGSTCVSFSDSYIWLIFDSIGGWREETCDKDKIEVAIGFRGQYSHIEGTTLVRFDEFDHPGLERLLTVRKSGKGSGTVISSPAGINCGTDCSQSFLDGATVTLTATSGEASTFAGWFGACTGKGSCVVSMDAAKTVTARFALAFGPPVPSAPSGLTATAISQQQVLLTWHDSSTNEDTFRIEMRRGQQAFREVATVGANGTRVVISNLHSDTRYFFRIRARNTFGFSTYSNQAFVTTPE